mmetsp:Transcript_3290/g.11012  ORF Transcript_3290/g.11012 Transcript_3290/m.11012 type:complete len:203 (-) Transcript_3290:153-761(-)
MTAFKDARTPPRPVDVIDPSAAGGAASPAAAAETEIFAPPFAMASIDDLSALKTPSTRTTLDAFAASNVHAEASTSSALDASAAVGCFVRSGARSVNRNSSARDVGMRARASCVTAPARRLSTPAPIAHRSTLPAIHLSSIVDASAAVAAAATRRVATRDDDVVVRLRDPATNFAAAAARGVALETRADIARATSRSTPRER